jgi:transposase InsO family protein
MEELLNKLYYDPSTGFQGLDKLYRKAKLVDPKVTKKRVKEWLDEQATQQITSAQKKTKKIYSTIISPRVRNNFQVDIMYLPNPTKNKFPYILTCIDVYSRKAFVVPIKNKTAITTLHAFKKLMVKTGKPKNINLDAGGEFDNTLFKKFCEENDIKLWISDPEADNKNAIVERFHRTLRGILLKYEVARGRPYIADLNALVENYNDSFHKTIKTTPNKIWKGEEPNKQDVNYVVYDFLVGDIVRHEVKNKAFTKASSNVKYTKDIYTISKIIGSAYYLTNKKGQELKKPFRGHELTKAVGEYTITTYDEENKANERKARIKRAIRRELY